MAKISLKPLKKNDVIFRTSFSTFSLNKNNKRKKYENQSKINRKLYKGKER